MDRGCGGKVMREGGGIFSLGLVKNIQVVGGSRVQDGCKSCFSPKQVQYGWGDGMGKRAFSLG